MSGKTVKRPSAKAYAKTVAAYKKEIACLQEELRDEIRRRETAMLEECKMRQDVSDERGKVRQTEIWWREALIRQEEAEKIIRAMLKEKYLDGPGCATASLTMDPVVSQATIELLKHGTPGTIHASWLRTEKGDATNE